MKNSLRTLAIIILVVLALLFLLGRASATDTKKQNLCHKTSSDTNPWEAISVSDNNHTHDGHAADFPYTGPTKDNGQPTKEGDAWCEDNAPPKQDTPPQTLPQTPTNTTNTTSNEAVLGSETVGK